MDSAHLIVFFYIKKHINRVINYALKAKIYMLKTVTFFIFFLPHTVLTTEKIDSFTLTKEYMTKLEEDESSFFYRVERYASKNNDYIDIIHTFPLTLRTNCFISSNKTTLTKAHNYTPEQVAININAGFPNPDTTEVTVIDQDKLSTLINSFLGNIGINKRELRLYYNVQPNDNPDIETIIKCYEKSHNMHDIPSSEYYTLFCLRTNLLVRYSTRFSPATVGGIVDERNTIFLHFLNNHEKKHVITVPSQLTVDSIFLLNYLIIVGLYKKIYTDDRIQNEYYVYIYNTKQFLERNDDIAQKIDPLLLSRIKITTDKDTIPVDIIERIRKTGEPLLTILTTDQKGNFIIFDKKNNATCEVPIQTTNPIIFRDKLVIKYLSNDPFPIITPPKVEENFSDNNIDTDTDKKTKVSNNKIYVGIALFSLLLLIYNYKRILTLIHIA